MSSHRRGGCCANDGAPCCSSRATRFFKGLLAALFLTFAAVASVLRDTSATAASAATVRASTGRRPPPCAQAIAPVDRGSLDDIMARHGSRMTRASWLSRAAGGGPPPPVFFLTAARAWGASSADVNRAREEQYVSNIGNIISLGYRVYVAVSPPPAGSTDAGGFPLIEELARAAAPGQVRVHYCSTATAVKMRSGGPDEVLCMQEAIPALFKPCVGADAPWSVLAPAPAGCDAPDAHVIRMSGRYLMAKYSLLHDLFERGARTDAFVKWHLNWTEGEGWGNDEAWAPQDVRQVATFFLSMRVRDIFRRAPRVRVVGIQF